MGELGSSLVSSKISTDIVVDNPEGNKFMKQWMKAIVNNASPDEQDSIVPTPLNRIRRINKYLESVNTKLKIGDHLIVKFEPQSVRRSRIENKSPRILGKLRYFLGDFLFHRVLARLAFTKKIYFGITNGKNRSISLTEGLGRVISCGFKVIEYQSHEDDVYILAQKSGEPVYDNKVSYGAIVRLSRIGYQEQELGVYKLRTMRPYSEFVQKFIYDKNGTSDGDKIIEDFRVASWGLILRKFWLDELPMIWNFLKGDLKIVGIRPLSKHKFDIYPTHLQELRIKSKPGLVPPYYADLPKSQQEFFDTEERYLNAYFKSPFKTDVIYFFRALKNIFLRGARSK